MSSTPGAWGDGSRVAWESRSAALLIKVGQVEFSIRTVVVGFLSNLRNYQSLVYFLPSFVYTVYDLRFTCSLTLAGFHISYFVLIGCILTGSFNFNGFRVLWSSFYLFSFSSSQVVLYLRERRIY